MWVTEEKVRCNYKVVYVVPGGRVERDMNSEECQGGEEVQ